MRKCRFHLRSSPKGSTLWSSPGSVDGLNGLAPKPQTNTKNHRKEGEPWSVWMQRVAVNTFEPKPSDDKAFGGDHYTGKQDAMNELKMMDRRLQTFNHPELLANCLKCIVSLDGPRGERVDPRYLDGRIVGICVVGDTDRSINFLPYLEKFQEKHKGDFVVVTITQRMTESQHLARQHGFHHCTFRNGGGMVIRDMGLLVYGFVPLPRLVIIDGTTGFEITKSGLTGVLTNPDHCFAEWAQGRPGFDWWKYPKTWYGLQSGDTQPW